MTSHHFAFLPDPISSCFCHFLPCSTPELLLPAKWVKVGHGQWSLSAALHALRGSCVFTPLLLSLHRWLLPVERQTQPGDCEWHTSIDLYIHCHSDSRATCQCCVSSGVSVCLSDSYPSIWLQLSARLQSVVLPVSSVMIVSDVMCHLPVSSYLSARLPVSRFTCQLSAVYVLLLAMVKLVVTVTLTMTLIRH